MPQTDNFGWLSAAGASIWTVQFFVSDRA